MSERHIWKKTGFEEFMKGTLGNGGQNLYVSKKGALQRIFQYDITGNGYPDLLFANSHSMNERPPLYLFDNPILNKEPKKLRSNGAYDGIMCDLTGDGKMDMVIACQHNGVHSDITSILYFSSEDGLSEKYMMELPVPSAMGVVAGDFNGSGKKALAFIGNKNIRVFYQTKLGIEACNYTDISSGAISISCADLDGDGYDDLYTLCDDGILRIYWGSSDGISSENVTELPYRVKIHEECTSTTAGRSAIRTLPWITSVVEYNGRKCVFRADSNGDAVLEAFNKSRKNTEVFRFSAGGAYTMISGDLTGSGSCDLVVGVQTDRCTFENSYVFFKKDGYKAEKVVPFLTRAVHSFTISPIKKNGRPYLFVSQTGTRYNNDVPCQIISFNNDGEISEKYEVMASSCTRILVGDTGGDDLQTVFVNHEGETPWGLEKIYIYTGDKDGYSPERRIELPACAAVDGYMIDFTDNGHPDVLLVNCGENAPHLCPGLTIFRNNGNGPEVENVLNIPMILPHGVAIGDFRKSGYLDIMTGGIRNREIRIYQGGPNGYSDKNVQKITFGPDADKFVPFPWDKEEVDPDYSDEENERIAQWGGLRWNFAADFNGDGYLDIFVSQVTGPNCMILWGGPDGFSLDNMQLLATDGAGCANAADLTGNGYLDLIIGGHFSLGKNVKRESYLTIYWGGPDGYKENRKTQLPVMCANSVCVGDFNGDGILDIFVTSYDNSRTRDIDSYVFYGSEGGVYSLDNMKKIRGHSSCGCVAGDFNGDGYSDLAVASHKKEGNHVCDSFVYWGGPDGINEERKTILPTVGVHGMTTVDMGNIYDRSSDEYYYSETYSSHNGRQLVCAKWDAEMPKSCAVRMQVRTADSEHKIKKAPWSDIIRNGDNLDKLNIKGKFIEYRLNLFAKNGCGTPRVKSITLEFK